jgi:hypothetical protein
MGPQIWDDPEAKYAIVFPDGAVLASGAPYKNEAEWLQTWTLMDESPVSADDE